MPIRFLLGNNVGTGFGYADVIILGYRKFNQMATVVNTIIDFCGNIFMNNLNKFTKSYIFHSILA